MYKICITGANGFIGRAICNKFLKLGLNVKGAVRTSDLKNNISDCKYISVGDINEKTIWKDALSDVDCVIHCAGLAHQIKNSSKDKIDSYNRVNVLGTARLANQAASAGVKRLIFLSSIKVNGEQTNSDFKKKNLNKTFKYDDIPKPQDSYAISKLEAEKVLNKISLKTGLEIVILRLPLVYGSGAKGNLRRMIKLISLGVPLPFGAIKNKRSMIGMDNLLDLLLVCIRHQNANGKTFLVSDDQDLSTPELIQYLADCMGVRVKLLSIPVFILKFLFFITGNKKDISRLVGSLRVDMGYTKDTLNWKPSFSVIEGIKQMIKTR